MLKELNKRLELARRQFAAWKRWARKQPHNRVRRPRLVDDSGRVIGYGPPKPWPEPPLHPGFLRKVRLPAGRTEVVLSDEVATAYGLARRPQPTEDAVLHVPLSEKEIRRLHERWCR